MEGFRLKNKNEYIPSLFTVLNILCGSAAILFALNRHYPAASWMIIIAVLCDGMDGKIARWVNGETEFGTQLDSLADLISSGVAPAVLAYETAIQSFPWYYSWSCLVYIFAGAYRLARFNVTQRGDRSKGYMGLPIPVAGMSIAALWLFTDALFTESGFILMTGFLIILSCLMISTVHYEWPKLEWNNGFRIVYSMFLLFAVMGMIIFTKYTLFPLLCLYIFIGWIQWIVSWIKAGFVLRIPNK